MKDYEFINKIEEITERRRSENPINQEADRLCNLIYPKEALNGFYRLGYCSALAFIKKDLYKCLCKYDQDIFDEIIKATKEQDKEYNTLLNKLIKEEDKL